MESQLELEQHQCQPQHQQSRQRVFRPLPPGLIQLLLILAVFVFMKLNSIYLNKVKHSRFSPNEKGHIPLEHFFLAYFDCRKNKRNKKEAVDFEVNYERELIKLWREVNNETYKVSPLDVFISERPVKREIFAAKFKDRIVHHLVVNKLEHILEKEFIFDTHSCRKGRGVHFAINRTKRHIRQCSKNYTEDCYILKLDIKGYFMSIDRAILLNNLENLINQKYFSKDKNKLIYLLRTIINNNSIKSCICKSSKEKWIGLPKSKSLFYAKDNCGLPIGNYTNQVLANLYLTPLDHFIKHNLKIKHYVRYVDDLVLIHSDKEQLKVAMSLIKEYVEKELNLLIHPKKIYLQHYQKGAEFLGVFIKPYRSYVTRRIKNNSYQAIRNINISLKEEKVDVDIILSKINSYLGLLSHSNTYNLKKKILNKLDPKVWDFFTSKNLNKIKRSDGGPKET